MDIVPILNFCSDSATESSSEVHDQWLPHELINEILERVLPVKSLVRFRCVSKSWNALIRSPTFIKNHRLRNESYPGSFICWDVSPGVLSFIDHPESLYEVGPSVPIPFTVDDTSFHYNLFGPCDGLICMVFKEYMVLCNPALREFKELPPYHQLDFNNFNTRLFWTREGEWIPGGFGKSCSDEYKIVLIVSNRGGFQKVQVYNLNTNSWKVIDSNFNGFPDTIRPCDQLFFNGACHWHALFSRTNMSDVGILCFNISTEDFQRIEYPDFLADARELYGGYDGYMTDIEKEDQLLVVVNECLAICRLDQSCCFDDDGCRNVVVWVMKEYGVNESWSKLYMIYSYPTIYPLVYEFWGNDQILEDTIRNGQLIPYKESLVSLN